MKKIYTALNKNASTASIWKTGLTLLVGVILAAGFWFVSLPQAHGAAATPAEMIQSNLPAGMTISTATDQQLLDAVCKAVRRHPREASLIVRTAAGARPNLRGDILCMAIRCSHARAADSNTAADCTWVLDLVREWMRVDPSLTNRLVETISECAPECRDALQNLNIGEGVFTNPPINVNPPPGSVGGGSGGNVCIVCHNGHEVQVACTDLVTYLHDHPGDTSGPCQPTPTTNP